MAALDGFRVRVVTDDIAGQYALWLLKGLGATVELVTTRAAEDWHAIDAWLCDAARVDRVPQRPSVAALAEGVDALIVDCGRQLDPRMYAALQAHKARDPGSVLLAISPWGATGPWARHRAGPQDIQAASGLLHATGDPDHPPSPVAGRVVEMATGVNAANGMLLALLRKLRHGIGSMIDVSMLETIVCLQASRILAYAYTGLVYRRNNDPSLNNFLLCKDGYLQATFWTVPFETALKVLEIPESALSPEVRGIEDRGLLYANSQVLELVCQALMKRSRAEWVERGLKHRMPIVPVYAPRELLDDPQLAHRGYFRDLPFGGKTLRVPGYPFKSPVWGATERHAPPMAKAPDPSSSPEVGSTLPLAGLRVTEVGLAWSGPMAAETCAQYGMEAVKLESPTRLDTARSLPLIDLDLKTPWWEYTYNYHPVNAGKRHFGFNAAGPSAKKVGERLFKASDLVVTNYSVRALNNLGFDGESIRRINPRCSVAHSTGFGWQGPQRDWVAYGTGMEGMTGLALETGGALGPVRSPLLHPDIFASLHQMLGSFAALIRREACGEGAVIDLGQLECGAVTVSEAMAVAQGAAGRTGIPPRLLRCRGEDEWLSVSPRNVSEAERVDALCAHASREDKRALAERLQAAGIAAAPVLGPDEVLQLPHLKARDYFARVDGPFGPQLAIGRWHRFDDLPRAPLDGVQRFGTENDAMLRQTLGFTQAEIDTILADGTVGPAPTDSPQPSSAGSPIDWMVRTRQIYRRDADFRERLGLVRPG